MKKPRAIALLCAAVVMLCLFAVAVLSRRPTPDEAAAALTRSGAQNCAAAIDEYLTLGDEGAYRRIVAEYNLFLAGCFRSDEGTHRYDVRVFANEVYACLLYRQDTAGDDLPALRTAMQAVAQNPDDLNALMELANLRNHMRE